MKRFGLFVLLLTFFLQSGVALPLFAEPQEEAPSIFFDLDLPEGWRPTASLYQGVPLSYEKAGSYARLDVKVQEAPPGAGINTLSWPELFYPQFDLIDLRMDARTTLGGVPAKYCLYKIKKSSFKKELEGKLDFMYLNYVLVYNGFLYSLTFSDEESSFTASQPEFMQITRTLRLEP